MSNKYYVVPSHAEIYNKFRPSPPQQLAKRLVNYLTEKVTPELLEQAVDIGCGGGQSTEILAPYFKKVLGFDASEAQIIAATRKNKFKNITYRVGNAEHINCADSSVQLVTTCHACQYFDLPKFYAEVERVLTPGGVLCLYGYALPQPMCGDKQLSHIVNKFYCDTLEDYVFPHSKVVYLDKYTSSQYNNIPFVAEPLVRDEFVHVVPSVSVSDLVGYASSMSGFQNFKKQVGAEKASQVLNNFQSEIMSATELEGDAADIHLDIQYTYFLLMGRKSPAAS
ncbi:hypothetical protein L9F63_024019 [Diploptera punctata]|uniref:Methyltransferase type 11 domain-containing protein n=1 Tax=Diploptera punctata TaxID=6984 RepID=A0AAD7ZHT1_DIPPU|nr:hypothetical protein L9F63_024019 [Diploptera punctata]